MLDVNLDIRAVDGQAVISLCGEFDLADAPGVASHLITAVAACGPSVIVDLAGLESIGYSGLAVLLRVRKWAHLSHGDLALAAPQPAVHLVLQATGLIDVFSVYRSVDEAACGVLPSAPLRIPLVPPPRRPVYRGACQSPGRPQPDRFWAAGSFSRRPGICRRRYRGLIWHL